MSEKPLFSRRQSNPIGKCTVEYTIHLPEEAVDALAVMAFTKGITKGEYARNVILEHLFGAAVMEQLKQDKRNA